MALPERQDQNLALTVSYVPCSIVALTVLYDTHRTVKAHIRQSGSFASPIQARFVCFFVFVDNNWCHRRQVSPTKQSRDGEAWEASGERKKFIFLLSGTERSWPWLGWFLGLACGSRSTQDMGVVRWARPTSPQSRIKSRFPGL